MGRRGPDTAFVMTQLVLRRKERLTQDIEQLLEGGAQSRPGSPMTNNMGVAQPIGSLPEPAAGPASMSTDQLSSPAQAGELAKQQRHAERAQWRAERRAAKEALRAERRAAMEEAEKARRLERAQLTEKEASLDKGMKELQGQIDAIYSQKTQLLLLIKQILLADTRRQALSSAAPQAATSLSKQPSMPSTGLPPAPAYQHPATSHQSQHMQQQPALHATSSMPTSLPLHHPTDCDATSGPAAAPITSAISLPASGNGNYTYPPQPIHLRPPGSHAPASSMPTSSLHPHDPQPNGSTHPPPLATQCGPSSSSAHHPELQQPSSVHQHDSSTALSGGSHGKHFSHAHTGQEQGGANGHGQHTGRHRRSLHSDEEGELVEEGEVPAGGSPAGHFPPPPRHTGISINGNSAAVGNGSARHHANGNGFTGGRGGWGGSGPPASTHPTTSHNGYHVNDSVAGHKRRVPDTPWDSFRDKEWPRDKERHAVGGATVSGQAQGSRDRPGSWPHHGSSENGGGGLAKPHFTGGGLHPHKPGGNGFNGGGAHRPHGLGPPGPHHREGGRGWGNGNGKPWHEGRRQF